MEDSVVSVRDIRMKTFSWTAKSRWPGQTALYFSMITISTLKGLTSPQYCLILVPSDWKINNMIPTKPRLLWSRLKMKALFKTGPLHIIMVIMHCQSYFGLFSFNLMLLQLKFKQTNEFNKQDVIVKHVSAGVRRSRSQGDHWRCHLKVPDIRNMHST